MKESRQHPLSWFTTENINKKIYWIFLIVFAVVSIGLGISIFFR